MSTVYPHTAFGVPEEALYPWHASMTRARDTVITPPPPLLAIASKNYSSSRNVRNYLWPSTEIISGLPLVLISPAFTSSKQVKMAFHMLPKGPWF